VKNKKSVVWKKVTRNEENKSVIFNFLKILD